MKPLTPKLKEAILLFETMHDDRYSLRSGQFNPAYALLSRGLVIREFYDHGPFILTPSGKVAWKELQDDG